VCKFSETIIFNNIYFVIRGGGSFVLIHEFESPEAMIYNLTRTQFFITIVPCLFQYRVVDNYLRALKTESTLSAKLLVWGSDKNNYRRAHSGMFFHNS